MPQGDKTEMIKFLGINGHKGHQGQICNGTISKNTDVMRNTICVCGKFHAFTKKCMIYLILGASYYTKTESVPSTITLDDT